MLGAAGASIVLAGIETYRLVAHGGSFFPSLIAACVAYTLLTVVAAGAVWGVLEGLTSLLRRVRAERGWPLAQLLVVGFATIGMAAGVWGGLRVADMLFSSPGLQRIAVATGAAGLAWVLIWLARTGFHRMPWNDRHVGERALGDVVVAVSALLAALFAVLEPDTFEELNPTRLLPYVAAFAGAALGWAHLGSSRVVRLASTATVGLLLAASLAGFFVSPSAATRSAIAQWGWMTPLTTRSHTLSKIDAAPTAPAKGTATCFARQRAPAPESLAPVPEDAPNIIFVTADALRWDHTTLGGHARDTTPRLATLAKNAAVFRRAYTPASSTRQTFRAIFTGVHPSQAAAPKTSRWSISLGKGQETLASYLSAAGYFTVAVVTATRTFHNRARGLHGFELIDTTPRRWWDERKYSAPLVIDRLIAHVSEARDGRPKFVWTHLMETHQGYHPGPEPVDFGRDAPARYDEAIHFVDREVSRLVEWAQSPARRDNTWIIFTSDHGHAFKEHGKRFHGHSVYEEEVHVPLIVWGPGVEPKRYDEPVNLLDLYPTILELAGVDEVDVSCGTSLTPVVTGQRPLEASPVFVEQVPDTSAETFHAAFIDGHLKLALRPKEDALELFDLEADPGEKKNLAATRPDTLQKMRDALVRYLKERHMEAGYYGLGDDDGR